MGDGGPRMIAHETIEERTRLKWDVAIAMGKTGAGALASALLAAAGAKILAAWLGPSYIALIATLQQTRQAALSVATANGQTALVQGANSLSGVERREFLRTALVLIAIATLAASGVLIFARERMARAAGLDGEWSKLIGWLAAPVILGSVLVVATALINALGKIGRLAILNVAGPAAAAILAWPTAFLVTRGHTGAISVSLACSAAASAGAAVWLLRGHGRTVFNWIAGPGRWWSTAAARHFLSISGVMAATGLVASAGLLGVRARIIRVSGMDVAGNFDAAWAISMNQATLVLGSLQAYFLPQLARASNDAERREHVTHVLGMAIGVAAPLIISIALMRGLAIEVFYSPKFLGAADFLRWTLVGDYFKVTAWVMAMPMIALADMRAFLAADAVAQIVFLGLSVLLARIRSPAEAAAMAFAASYAMELLFCYAYLRRRIGWRFGVLGWWWTAGLGMILGTVIVRA
jgi:O-antigen/teichoic acid export membrane protein